MRWRRRSPLVLILNAESSIVFSQFCGIHFPFRIIPFSYSDQHFFIAALGAVRHALVGSFLDSVPHPAHYCCRSPFCLFQNSRRIHNCQCWTCSRWNKLWFHDKRIDKVSRPKVYGPFGGRVLAPHGFCNYRRNPHCCKHVEDCSPKIRRNEVKQNLIVYSKSKLCIFPQ